MERITVFDGKFWAHKNFPPVKDDTVDEFVDCVKELAARLAAYEDTGLEPEEIRDSIGGISPICVQCDGKTSDGVVTEKCGYPDDITKCLEQSKHLCELAQAEKEGRLVVLQNVKYTDSDGEKALRHAMYMCGVQNNPVTRYTADAIAEKLTREAAEAALEEREAEHDR